MKKEITIKDFVSAIEYKIGEGNEYRWDCFGGDASMLDWVSADLSATASIVYDSKTHVVYEMSVWGRKIYRWIRPENLKRYKSECKKRGHSFVYALDKIKYEDTTPGKILAHLKRAYNRPSSNLWWRGPIVKGINEKNI